MTTLEIKLSLPDGFAKEAKKAGLLNAPAIEALLREAMRARLAGSCGPPAAWPTPAFLR